VPSLVPLLAAELALDDELAERVRAALDGKDGAAVATLPAAARERFQPLAAIGGAAEEALAALQAMSLPESAGELVDRLASVVTRVAETAPQLALTLDPGESRGFEYQSGVSFTLFAKGVRGELGRGGRYRIEGDDSATGFTLYLDSLMRAVPEAEGERTVYLPSDCAADVGAQLRDEGWRTLQALDSETNVEAEARRLGCSHVLQDGRPIELT
jgi:ATP phosphoribosyltransferase regulatory subunit